MLIASYAITEEEFCSLKTQAEIAWPDITNEEAFAKEFHDFYNHKCKLSSFTDDNNCFFALPQDNPNTQIWLHTTSIQPIGIIAYKKDASYTRLISKAIVIRNISLNKKGLDAISEPKKIQLYYHLLKELFLKKGEELFLQTVCTLIRDTNTPFNNTPIVCVLKDKSENPPLKKQRQKNTYLMDASCSIVAAFLLHKLLEKRNRIHNNDQILSINHATQKLTKDMPRIDNDKNTDFQKKITDSVSPLT